MFKTNTGWWGRYDELIAPVPRLHEIIEQAGIDEFYTSQPGFNGFFLGIKLQKTVKRAYFNFGTNKSLLLVSVCGS